MSDILVVVDVVVFVVVVLSVFAAFQNNKVCFVASVCLAVAPLVRVFRYSTCNSSWFPNAIIILNAATTTLPHPHLPPIYVPYLVLNRLSSYTDTPQQRRHQCAKRLKTWRA